MSDAVQTYYKVCLFRTKHHVRHIRLVRYCEPDRLGKTNELIHFFFFFSKWEQNRIAKTKLNHNHKGNVYLKKTAFFCAIVLCYSHMHVWRLKAALVNVVVGEGLRGVGAVLVHRDGHFALWRHSVGHSFSTWHMRHFTRTLERPTQSASFRTTT